MGTPRRSTCSSAVLRDYAMAERRDQAPADSQAAFGIW
jgi:hypothetical protein